MTVELTQEDQKNGAEHFGEKRLINVSFDNCSMLVEIPSAITSSNDEILDEMKFFYDGLLEARSKLSVVPSKIKSNGDRRSTRELRDIKKVREKQLNSVRQAIDVFRGNLPGVIVLMPSLDRKTNEFKPAGFKIVYTSNFKS